MYRRKALLTSFLPALMLAPAFAPAGQDSIISEHIRVRIPMELEWVARDTVADLERCYVFIDGVMDGKLPRRVLVDVTWDNGRSGTDLTSARIRVGMRHAAANSDMRAFLMHTASREMARLGLGALGRANAPREENEFLYEGMAEILAREFEHTSRKLDGAWIIARLLDRMGLLGIPVQASWSAFAEGRHDLRAAAPGVTFLLTCRELHGRERTMKLFEHLGRKGLSESVSSALRTGLPAVERAWLERVRKRAAPGEIVEGEADSPRPERTVYSPQSARPGRAIQIRFTMRPGTSVLMPEGLFLEEASGRVIAGRAGSEKDTSFLYFDVPVEKDRQPGSYPFRVVAVDYAGNIGTWGGTYTVE